MIDSPHFLSRTLSDVCELDAFSEAIATTLSVLTFFSHSTQATTHLTRARGTLDISRGLEKIGKTRYREGCQKWTCDIEGNRPMV